MTFPTSRLIFLPAALVALSACGTTKVVETWESDTIQPEQPNKVAVLVVWPDQLQRLVIERDMVEMRHESSGSQSAPLQEVFSSALAARLRGWLGTDPGALAARRVRRPWQ